MAATDALLQADERLVETLLWLCRIPSPTGEEGPIADALVDRMASWAIAAPVRRHLNSLVVPLFRAKNRRQHLVLAGHTDVVRTAHDGAPRVEGDRIYGPGAADMKSGLALLIDLAESSDQRERLWPALERAGLDITLVFYAREEGPYDDNELGPCLDEDPELQSVDLAVCLEPSDNRLALGAMGSIHAELHFEGKTAHSARPWQGDNAIHKAGPLLVDIAARGTVGVEIDGHIYRSTMSVTTAQGGRARNVVPDELVLNLNYRFTPDRSIEQALQDVRSIVADRCRIGWTDNSPAALPHAHHPLIEALADSGVASVEPKQAWTDVARFAEHDIVAVNWGPGDNAQAHQPNESTSLKGLLTGRVILERWLHRAAAVSAGSP